MYAHVSITKLADESPSIEWLNPPDEVGYDSGDVTLEIRDRLLPDFVLGYSSGENEILSLPFFKMRFIQYDEYWHALKTQKGYPGHPDTRMAYLDEGFSQAILLCNLLYEDDIEDEAARQAERTRRVDLFCSEVGLQGLKEFRIIIKHKIMVPGYDRYIQFKEGHPALDGDKETFGWLRLTHQLEDQDNSKQISHQIINRLKRCAALHYTDPKTDTLYLDYYVDAESRKAFRKNFKF